MMSTRQTMTIKRQAYGTAPRSAEDAVAAPRCWHTARTWMPMLSKICFCIPFTISSDVPGPRCECATLSSCLNSCMG